MTSSSQASQAFINIGERTNVTGSAKFRNLIKAGDYDADQDMAEVMADMTSGDERRLRFLIERHMKFTGSTRAEEILNNWQAMLPKFVKVMPVDYRRALAEMKTQEEQSHVTLAAGE